MMLLVLWVLGAEAGQVGLVAVQTPWVQAPPRGLVPVSIFHQEGDVGAEVELGPQEGSGRAAAEGAQDSQGRPEDGEGPSPVTVGPSWAGLRPRRPLAPLQDTAGLGCPSAQLPGTRAGQQPPLGADTKARVRL